MERFGSRNTESFSGTVNKFRRVVDVKNLFIIFENFRTGDMFQYVVKSDVDLFKLLVRGIRWMTTTCRKRTGVEQTSRCYHSPAAGYDRRRTRHL